jgi:hypothetical protein
LPSPIPKVSAKKYQGLGDVIHAVAQPIAKAIDIAIGTNIDGCSGCQKRREILNRNMPL